MYQGSPKKHYDGRGRSRHCQPEKLEVRASFVEGQADDEGITGVEVNEEERFLNET